MEKEQEQKPENDVDPLEGKTEASTVENQIDVKFDKEEKEQKNEITPEEKINELEDKLARAFAEMENQRRTFKC